MPDLNTIRDNRVIGMVHLQPLPGAPLYKNNFQEVIDAAKRDAEALVRGGIQVLMVENFGDIPFYPNEVPPITVASMSLVICQIKTLLGSIPIGVNVLRNDAKAALAIAAACGINLIRVNIHNSVMVTDQGVIQGKAYETARLRTQWCPETIILADAHVKHALPLTHEDILDAVENLWERSLVQGVILSGTGTGKPLDINELAVVKDLFPDIPLVAGSGVTSATIREILQYCEMVIVGTYLKKDGGVHAPVDIERVKALLDAM